jgi:transposase
MKYAALDVHQSSVVICVRDARGIIVHQAVVATEARALRSALAVVRGPLLITCEQGPLAAWIRSTLARRAKSLIVCDPRRTGLRRYSSKTDRLDAERLSELLRLGALSAIHMPLPPIATLRDLVCHYDTLVRDTIVVKQRIKALFRREAVVSSGATVFSIRHRRKWLRRLSSSARRFRLAALFAQLDTTERLRKEARSALIDAAEAHPAFAHLQSIPAIGPIRAAVLIACIATPDRFSSRRRFWSYAGLAVRLRGSGEHSVKDGQMVRNPKALVTKGLGQGSNRRLKRVLIAAAVDAARREGPMRKWFTRLVRRGVRPAAARLALARKIGLIVLALWREETRFAARRFAAARR